MVKSNMAAINCDDNPTFLFLNAIEVTVWGDFRISPVWWWPSSSKSQNSHYEVLSLTYATHVVVDFMLKMQQMPQAQCCHQCARFLHEDVPEEKGVHVPYKLNNRHQHIGVNRHTPSTQQLDKLCSFIDGSWWRIDPRSLNLYWSGCWCMLGGLSLWSSTREMSKFPMPQVVESPKRGVSSSYGIPLAPQRKTRANRTWIGCWSSMHRILACKNEKVIL